MASLQGASLNRHVQREEETRTIHLVKLENAQFPANMPEPIESDDSIEFTTNDSKPVDIIQVYLDDKDFYLAHKGFQLRNLTNRTPQADRQFNLSFALTKPSVDLFFCVIPSSENENPPKGNKYPREKCERNRVVIQKPEFKVELTDEPQNQKMYLHKGDTVEITWSSSQGISYRIEERHYCPVSGGLYPVHNDNAQREPAPKGKFKNTFLEYDMTFFVRLTAKNQVYDLTTCLVHDRYSVIPIRITDQSIEPNLIWIEQTDYIEFEWNTKQKQSIVEIDPSQVDPKTRNSIEVCIAHERFFYRDVSLPFRISGKMVKTHSSGPMNRHVAVWCTISFSRKESTVSKRKTIKSAPSSLNHRKWFIMYRCLARNLVRISRRERSPLLSCPSSSQDDYEWSGSV